MTPWRTLEVKKVQAADSSSLRPREAAVKKLTTPPPTLRLVPPTSHQLTPPRRIPPLTTSHPPPNPIRRTFTTHHTHHHRHPIPCVHAPVLPPRAERLPRRSRAACSARAPRISHPALCQSAPALTWSGRRLHVSTPHLIFSVPGPCSLDDGGPRRAARPKVSGTQAKRRRGRRSRVSGVPDPSPLPIPPPSAVVTRGISLLPR